MRIFFIHQSAPSQFVHLVNHFASRPDVHVTCIGKKQYMDRQALPATVFKAGYPAPPELNKAIHPYLERIEANVLKGEAVVQVALALRRAGQEPDLIFVHPGWGEGLFLRDVYPDVPVIAYAETWYERPAEEFDPEFPLTIKQWCGARLSNLTRAPSLESATAALTPTHWQWSMHPEHLRSKMAVIFDGIDCDMCKPAPMPGFRVEGIVDLRPEQEIITYTTRSLEPIRGFHIFMRALPEMMRRRPQARFVVVGKDDVSYGLPPASGKTWRETMLDEVGHELDMDRLHFLPWISHPALIHLFRLSSVHIYLTYPFVLSWSVMEAMATGVLLVASDTEPVREVVQDGVNGYLTPFHDPAALAERVDLALRDTERAVELRRRARETILTRYDLKTVCLPAQIAFMEDVLAGRFPHQRSGG